MLDIKSIDELARRIHESIPPGAHEAAADLRQHIRASLQAGLGKLDLVTREEFDVQRAVLLRTREKVESLEQMVDALEDRLQALAGPDR